MFAVGYSDTEQCEADAAGVKEEMTRLGASVGYSYNLSKRTNVYGVASYYQDSYDNYQNEKDKDYDPSTAILWLGMRHKF